MIWRIELLGGISARSGDVVEDRFSTRKVAELLGFLALSPGTRYSREYLAALLWPEGGDMLTLRARLKQVLSCLRRQLEPRSVEQGSVIKASRDFISLSHEVKTDVQDFEREIEFARVCTPAQCRGHLEGALRIYSGKLLAGQSAEWIYPMRNELHDTLLECADRLTSLFIEEGNQDAAILILKRVVAMDHWDQPRHLKLMQVLTSAGRSPEALETYAKLKKCLKKDLEIDPTEEIETHAKSIQHQPGAPVRVQQIKPSTPRCRKRQISAPPTRFFGHEQEIAMLKEIHASRHVRLMTLLGVGGSGKTRLAIEFGRQMIDDRNGEVWFVPLINCYFAFEILWAVLDSLGAFRASVLPTHELVLHELGKYDRPLLILDNFEHLVEVGAIIVKQLLNEAPNLTILVTSRQALGIEGEHKLQIPSLPYPKDDKIGCDELLCYPSIQLFMDRAKMVRPDFQITSRTSESISALVRGLEGMPLALELCASLASTATTAQILSGLANRFKLLLSTRRDVPHRHRSLRDVLDYSYKSLSEDFRRGFCNLSAFQSGWTEDAATAVLGIDDAGSLFRELLDRSLIVNEEQEVANISSIRFNMLESIREFGKETLTPVERSQVSDRHATYYLGFLQMHDARYEVEGAPMFAAIESEYPNILAALIYKIGSIEVGAALDFCLALWQYWFFRGNYKEGDKWFQSVLTLPGFDDLPVPKRCLAARRVGSLAWKLSDYDRMFAEYTQALLLAEKCGDRAMIATAKMNLISHKTWSSIDEVPPGCYEDAWEDAVASGNKSTLTMILINWSGWHSSRGNVTEAEEALNEALSLIDQTEQNLRRPFVLNHLAMIKKLQKDFGGAKGLLSETLAWFEKLGIRSELSTVLSALAEIAFLEGQYLDAANLCSKVLDEIVETGNKTAFTEVVTTCIAVANQAGRDEATVTLWSAFDQLSSQPFWQGLHFDEQTAQLQTVLGDDVYYQLRKAGSKLSHEEIILQARAMLAGVLQSAVAP